MGRGAATRRARQPNEAGDARRSPRLRRQDGV